MTRLVARFTLASLPLDVAFTIGAILAGASAQSQPAAAKSPG
jgi:hypothetical protein